MAFSLPEGKDLKNVLRSYLNSWPQQRVRGLQNVSKEEIHTREGKCQSHGQGSLNTQKSKAKSRTLRMQIKSKARKGNRREGLQEGRS